MNKHDFKWKLFLKDNGKKENDAKIEKSDTNI